ncbi:4Fe-4S binding protein [Sedimenticola selenatireducens]|uniref:4Fe-4S dicluster domain-containing protein n=1 Tax=Sedimenticola selenatireducens TaxID=191960 RepID=A0A558DUI3_9GAMM|nr:4Fe-4S binding protein [Sedimenticola selenatireducens]TVO72455.1 4Fe-4S dicluster domain-containing protein [Sedimenticola selenatireducens]TVT64710.1 MAG: 4Fe-4S dicluster domain-containing protein [Sedimenticola selenatireducens]
MSDQAKSKKPVKRHLSPKQIEQNRREFLRSSVLAVGVMGISLVGLLPVVQGKSLALRPPGAIKTPSDEQDFLSSCIKCGQCVQVCPVNAIKLAELDTGAGVGVPFIDARDQACDFSCDGLQCVLACPTGALTHDLDYPADTRMGFAKVAEPRKCLAIQGKGFKGQARGPDYPGLLRYDDVDRWNPIPVADYPYDLALCDLCVRQCPIEIRITQCAAADAAGDKNKDRVAQRQGNECPPKHAIALEPIVSDDGIKRMKPVILEGCVGCGVCEMICPPDPPAIVIDIMQDADTIGGVS